MVDGRKLKKSDEDRQTWTSGKYQDSTPSVSQSSSVLPRVTNLSQVLDTRRQYRRGCDTVQTTEMLFRALIRTHHMTSRKKIAAITKAAKHQNCAVYVRTGTWRGVMIGECEEEEGLRGWVGDVKVCTPPEDGQRLYLK